MDICPKVTYRVMQSLYQIKKQLVEFDKFACKGGSYNRGEAIEANVSKSIKKD